MLFAHIFWTFKKLSENTQFFAAEKIEGSHICMSLGFISGFPVA